MKVASKINSLMLDLENDTLEANKDKIEMEIIIVADLIPKEVELIKSECELRKMIYAETQGVMVDYDTMYKTKEKVSSLIKEIDEEILTISQDNINANQVR